MIRTPALIRSRLTISRPPLSRAWLPWPVPSSGGLTSLRMREDTMLAPGAMPPGQAPTGAPAMIWAT